MARIVNQNLLKRMYTCTFVIICMMGGTMLNTVCCSNFRCCGHSNPVLMCKHVSFMQIKFLSNPFLVALEKRVVNQ
uniref:Uncharacterized protein n=1 Tax=Anguilla anguilla TaxID=7936 RepID=A0A0E9QZD3_ANGAN